MKTIIERFFLNEKIEICETTSEGAVRQLQPTFVNSCWEVYALHTDKGIFYAHIGLHGGKRVYYEANSSLSSGVRRYVLLGRDFAYQLISKSKTVYEEWRAFMPCPETAKLETIISHFVDDNCRYLQVTAILFDKKEKQVTICLSAPQSMRYGERKMRVLKQTEDGYELISCE